MSKLCCFIMAGFVLSTSPAAFAKDRAVEINISGIGPPVDIAAFRTVRQVIGHAVANGVVDKFIVIGRGIEGGFTACAEAGLFVRANELTALARQLRSIVPNPATTAYSIELSSSCAVISR